MIDITLPNKPDLPNIRCLDLSVLPMVEVMQRVGIALDIPHLSRLTVKLRLKEAEAAAKITPHIPQSFLDSFVGKSFNLNSPPQVATLLFDELGIGESRRLRRTRTGLVSTGKKQLELLDGEHPIVRLVLDYREYVKLRTTYTEKLPRMVVEHDKGHCSVCGLTHNTNHWRVHTEIPTTRTETGRFASRNPNLQNIPARTELGREVRAAFKAEEGKLLVMCDLSQIELRVLAHLADEQAMKDVFARDGDIHTATAALVFSRPESEVDKLTERVPCKNVNFAVAYGETDAGLQAQLALSGLQWSQRRCESFIDQWFAVYPAVQSYMELQHERARRYGKVWDLFGRVRYVPEVRSVHEHVVQAGLRQAGNMPIQSTAAGILKLAMASLHGMESDGTAPLLPVHDELIYEAHEADAEDWANTVSGLMESCCKLDVPIKCEGRTDKRWTKD